MPAKISQDSRTSFTFTSLRPLLRSISSLFLLSTFFALPLNTFAEEIIKNPGFESGLEHWQDKVSGAIIEESSEAHSGNKAIKITKSSSGSGGAQQTISGLTVGSFYKINTKAKRISESGSGKLRIAWYEEGSTRQKDTVDSSSTEGGDWTTLEIVVQVPDNVATAKVRLLATSADDKSTSVLFDDLEITQTQPTSTPAPSPTPTFTPTPEPTATNTPSPTPTGESEALNDDEESAPSVDSAVLGANYETDQPTGNPPSEAQVLATTDQAANKSQLSSKTKPPINPWALITIVVGVGLLGTAGFIYARDSGMLSQILHRADS